jgi:hypothetical protein
MIAKGTRVKLTAVCRSGVVADMILNVEDGTHSSMKRDILLENIDSGLYVHSYDKHGYILAVRKGKRTYILPCVLNEGDFL